MVDERRQYLLFRVEIGASRALRRCLALMRVGRRPTDRVDGDEPGVLIGSVEQGRTQPLVSMTASRTLLYGPHPGQRSTPPPTFFRAHASIAAVLRLHTFA